MSGMGYAVRAAIIEIDFVCKQNIRSPVQNSQLDILFAARGIHKAVLRELLEADGVIHCCDTKGDQELFV